MKKILFLAAVCAALMTSCGNSTQKLESERDSLQKVIDQKDEEINDVIGLFNEVQEGFSLINQAEGRVNMLAKTAEGNRQADNIRENMEFIQTTMEANRKKIEELEKKLNNSSLNATKLKETIQKLTADLEAKNTELEELHNELMKKDVQIATLNADVSILSTENEIVKSQRDASKKLAKNQEEQLNTAWYAIGNKKELQQKKIGYKMDGRDILKDSDFDKSYFTQIDIRQTLVIPTSDKKADILTNHPKDSYEWQTDTKGIKTLRITNAQKFWSLSKYLVIRVGGKSM